ncbi:MAG: hypothetical protein K2I80_00575, partial [Ruminococcus sp.]|nr:hypothetical protein [Ruminococcus sp.]
DSYFEFLPEMKVGDLIYEYYGEDYWVCNSDGIVEFWGTNKKDNSGLALHFSFVGKGIVDVPYIKYHKENETAHDISHEAFETYILSLYAQLDDSYITTQPITEQTTTTKAITIVATTTVTKKQDKVEKSKNYLPYFVLLNEIDAEYKREFGDTYIPYYRYYLYDINHDGIYELLIHFGESEAEAVIQIYSVDEDGEFTDLGEIGGGHTWLTEKTENFTVILDIKAIRR